MKLKFSLVLILFSLAIEAFCSSFSWDFSDCEIKDILFAVSLDTGISITTDDTISGKGNFRFAGSDFETAFDSFLKSERLFVQKSDEVWTVSKIRICRNGDLFSLDAFDLNAFQIVEKLTQELNWIVTFDSLPGGTYSIHLKNLEQNELLENLVKRFAGYELISEGKSFHIGKKNGTLNGNSGGFIQVRKERDKYFVDAKDCKSGDVLAKLFELGSKESKKEFCFLNGTEGKVVRSCFSGNSFDDVLCVFCKQNGLSVFTCDGIYYIMGDASGREKPGVEKDWEKVCLNFVKAEKFVSLMTKRLGKFDVVLLNDETFLAYLSKAEMNLVNELKEEIDLNEKAFEVLLKFLKPEELVKKLGTLGNKEKLKLSDDKSRVFFCGSENAYRIFMDEVEKIDIPSKRISYDLLILQFEDGAENSINGSIGAKTLNAGDRNSLGIQLGSVLNLNLNVISAFGLDFAGKLEASLESNKTKVFADTTLCGISGKAISFQNTNTYRYRDNNLDPETGKPVYSGITKEIISGLKLEITGTVSGDGLITSTVKASVTRQGNDTSGATGNPPPTSEKVITTEVCGKSGEPVILSGLVENSESIAQVRTPLLSKIPILGMFFKNKEKINQNSQMVIYLVPHLENENLIKSNKENSPLEERQRDYERCKKLLEA